MSKQHTEYLVSVVQAAATAPHGQKGQIYARAAEQLGITVKTLHERLNAVSTTRGQRKPRTDKGNTQLSYDEAALIAAVIKNSARRTGKRLTAVWQAVEILRSNGLLKAEVMDKATGELKPMSNTAIERAMRSYGLHPDQLDRPAPAQALRSLYPNHVWQIDASLCVLYYLPREGKSADELRVMDAAQFHHNKPANLKRIENDRVWRYAITDHASGTGYVDYVFGGESGENLSGVLINAMQYRGRHDPFHGVPTLVMLDPGSANTGTLFKNLCKALGVGVIINEVGNPRAKGQVENFHNIVERQFEGGLKLQTVGNLEELNTAAHRWMRIFNGQHIHRRHGMPRYSAWMRITADQLVKAPDVDTCKALTHEKPETRVLDAYMQVSWKGNQYDCGHVPGVSVGDKVEVARNPWKPDTLRIITTGRDGMTVFHEADMIRKDEYGFAVDGAVIGQDFKSHADTPTVKADKLLEKLAMEADTQAEAEGKRKAKTLPFGGKIDPYKPLEAAEQQQPEWLEKRGTASTVQAPAINLRPYTLVEAAKALMGRIGPLWLPECYGELQATYPHGEVPQEDLDRWERYFLGTGEKPGAKQRPALRVVGG